MVFASASKISYNTLEIHYTFWNVKMRYFCYNNPILESDHFFTFQFLAL